MDTERIELVFEKDSNGEFAATLKVESDIPLYNIIGMTFMYFVRLVVKGVSRDEHGTFN